MEEINTASLEVQVEAMVRKLIDEGRREELVKQTKKELGEAKRQAREIAAKEKDNQSISDKKAKKENLIKGFLKATIVAASPEVKNINFVPPQAREILAGLSKKNISSSSVEMILVYLGDYLTGDKKTVVNGELSKDFVGKIRELKIVDSGAANLIIDVLQEKGDELGLGPEAVEKIFSLSEGKNRGNQGNEIVKKFSQLNNEVSNYLDTLNFNTSALQSEIEKEEGKKIPPDKLNEKIQAKIIATRANLSLGLSHIARAGLSPEERGKRAINFTNQVNNLEARGVITKAVAEKLKNYAQQYFSLAERADRYNMVGRGNTLSQIARARGVGLGADAARYLDYLGDPRLFVNHFINNPQFQTTNGEIDFEKISSKIIDIAEEIISSVDYSPDKDFSHNFNPLMQGQVYLMLITAVRDLAENLGGAGDREVTIKTTAMLPDPSQDEKFPARRLAFPAEKTTKLSEALGETLVHNLSRFLSVSESLHNIGYIVNYGIGWEQLGKYTENLSMADVDWLFSRDEELSFAYQHYLTNLKDTLVLNGRVIPADFGRRESTNLNREQELTLVQLMAGRSSMDKTLSSDERVKMKRRLSRKIRLATAIAQGATGEFWGVLLTATMPITAKEGEGGRAEIDHIFTGPHHAGVEKMLAEIDVDKLFVRFDLPHYADAMRYLFIPRDLEKYEKWDHRLVYEVKRQYEDAMVHGASEEFLVFLRDHIIFADALRNPSVDIFARLSWRVEEYRAFLCYEAEKGGKRSLNFGKTIAKMMALGSLPTRLFIDDIGKYVTSIDLGTIPNNISHRSEITNLVSRINDLDREIAKLKKGSRKEERVSKAKEGLIKNLQQILYQDLLFGRMLTITPTRVIDLERRLYIPREEKLIQEQLRSFLKTKFSEQKIPPALIKESLLRMFLNAVSQVEKEILVENRKRAWEIIDSNGNIEEAIDLLNRGITTSDLQRGGRYEDLLKQAFSEFSQRQLTLPSYDGKPFKLSKIINEKDFFTILPEFFETLKKGIEEPRKRYEGEKYGQGPHSATIGLNERFYHWLVDLKILNYDIGADDLDMKRFLLQQAGRRVHVRVLGDTHNVAKEIVTSYKKLIFEEIPNFAIIDFPNTEAMMQFAEKQFTPLFVKIRTTLDMYAGASAANETSIRLTAFLRRMIGKDSVYDYLGVGTVRDYINRYLDIRQSSFLQDHFPSFVSRPTNSLNMGQMEKLGKHLLNMCRVPWKKKEIGGYDEKGHPIMKKNKFSVDDWVKMDGYTSLRKVWNRFIPITAVILLIMLIQLMREANKKNQK